MARFIPILLLLSLSLESFSSNRVIPFPKYGIHGQWSFTNLSFPYDANIVQAIFQDDQGMMWVGTRSGLFSYDGYSLKRHIENIDETDRCSIQTIVQIERNILCLGTDAGVSWFDMERECYCQPPAPLQRVKATCSLALFAGELWIGSRDEGLWAYNLKGNSLRQVPPEHRKESIVYALQPVGNELFIGSYEGLSCYDSRSRERRDIALDARHSTVVTSLCWDSTQGILWIGTEGVLYQYAVNEHSCSCFPWLQGNSFKAMRMDGNGQLQIGTDNGIFVYNPRHPEREPDHLTHDARDKHSLRNNTVWSVYCDQEHNIWFGTERGVSIIRNTASSQLIPLPDLLASGEGNLLSRLLIDSKGGYWLGGENGLIHIERSGRIRWFRQEDAKYYLRHNRIRHIYEDKEGILWIATDGSIARYDNSEERFIFYQITNRQGELNANWAYTILEDNRHRLWIATYQGGLFIADKQQLMEWDSSRPFPTLNNADIPALQAIGNTIFQLEPGEGGIIYAITRNGLSRIHPEKLQATLFPVYPKRMFYSNHALWYNIQEKLFRLEAGVTQPIRCPLEEDIQQIYVFGSDGGSLWLSTNVGISRLDHSTGAWTRLYPSDHYFQTSAFDYESGQMIWGGEDCLLSLPTNPENRPATRRLFVSAAYSDGIPLSDSSADRSEKVPRHSGKIKIARPNEELCLHLSSFSYLSEEEHYYYRLNSQSSWHALPQGENRLRFAKLSGGDYQLELAAAHPGYTPGTPVSRYFIHIPFPWYATPIAWTGYAGGVLLVLAVITYRAQLHNKRKYKEKEREKSLELSNLKMDFFVNISHELKTPLALIIAPLSQLLAEARNTPSREALESIYHNSLRLNTLIHKVLDFKQMEYESENTPLRSHVDLYRLLQNSLQTFETNFHEKGIHMEFTSNVQSLWLNLDQLKIESCIINILTNAIKYAPQTGGIISVDLSKHEDEVSITISDNGQGIDEKELPFVFIRFFQGKLARQQTSKGSGIGLYLVKKFIEMHGGHVEIRNRNGAVISMILPLKGDNLLNTAQTATRDQEEIQIEATQQKDLLIIDDNHEMVAFLTGVLSKEYHCRQAYNGYEGILLVNEQVPDLIIVDQMMPVMDGLNFCKTIRKNQCTADIPIIMLTAKDDSDTELASIRTGVDVFIPKPFDLKKLQLRIAQLLQKRTSLEKSLRIEAITQPSFPTDNNRKSSDEELMVKITKTIEENMEQENFTVTELSNMVGVEAKQLYRKVKQLTGMTPINYMRKLRMKKAALLLAQQKFTVSEVMYLVGYTSASHFAKCFSAEYGKTPKQYMEESLGMSNPQ